MGTMIEFDMAIDVAKENVKKLVPHAKDITVEGAIISDDGKLYEVTLSYELEDHRLPENSSKDNNLWTLARIMSKRREQKIFLVNSVNGLFRGFKNLKP